MPLVSSVLFGFWNKIDSRVADRFATKLHEQRNVVVSTTGRNEGAAVAEDKGIG